MREIKNEMILLTPKLAKALLADQHPNRNIRSRFVEQLVTDILADNWIVHHQGIAVDWDGRMTDGQHRCLAVIKANKAVRIQFSTGTTREMALVGVDQGGARSGGALLDMRGIKNPNTVSAILRTMAVLVFENESFGFARSPSRDLELLNRYGDQISRVIGCCGAKKFISPVMAPFVIDFNQEFIAKLVTAAELRRNSPELALHHTIGGTRTAATVGERMYQMLKTIAALDASARGEDINRLQVSPIRYRRWAKRHDLPANRSLLTLMDG